MARIILDFFGHMTVEWQNRKKNLKHVYKIKSKLTRAKSWTQLRKSKLENCLTHLQKLIGVYKKDTNSIKNLRNIYRVVNKFSDILNELFLVNWLISIFLWEYQMKNSIIPTPSENLNKINQRWPQLQPQTWSEVNLYNYVLGCSWGHFWLTL